MQKRIEKGVVITKTRQLSNVLKLANFANFAKWLIRRNDPKMVDLRAGSNLNVQNVKNGHF